MSALRLGRLPDGTRHVVVLEPAVGRIHATRYGIRGSAFDNPVVGSHASGEGQRSRDLRLQREAGARSRAVK